MPSFDVESKANIHEVKNAVELVKKEFTNRYDFRNSKSSVELKEDEFIIEVIADDSMKLEALQEMIRTRCAKRGVGPKCLEFEEAKPAASNTVRQIVKVKQGLSDEELKRVTKLVKETKLKVSAQIQGSEVRVVGKKRDDLQEVIQALRTGLNDLDLQFVNFRE